MSEVKTAVAERWDAEVLGAERPVLVDFWADWCGPCHRIAPVIEEIADERAGELEVFKLDVDAEPEVVLRHGVSAMPTLVLFSGGEEIGRIVGALPKNRLITALDEALSSVRAA
ncbi:MAG: thioredoxin [Rubrobacteraceae bacterium]